MPRGARVNVPEGIYHVTARGNRRQQIFLDDTDYRRFIQLVGRVAERRRWEVLAYCLMPNHYHLVHETLDADLSAGMHWLNSTYAHWFNRRHEVDGHLFQDRFYARLVQSDYHLLELTRYVVLNPVRAQLCGVPGAWQWSSYNAVLGETDAPRFLDIHAVLGFFGENADDARLAFGTFVRRA